jgi:hypothetical protein
VTIEKVNGGQFCFLSLTKFIIKMKFYTALVLVAAAVHASAQQGSPLANNVGILLYLIHNYKL